MIGYIGWIVPLVLAATAPATGASLPATADQPLPVRVDHHVQDRKSVV